MSSTLLIANNCTRENGQFLGDQLCYLKVAYLFVANQPDVDKVIMSMSPGNEMGFLWERFIRDPRGDGSLPPVDVVYDDFHPGDNPMRWRAWDKWRHERYVGTLSFQHYRELYLRIHGAHRQTVLCRYERGLGRKNIYEYVYYGQEHHPERCIGSDTYDVEIDHPPLIQERDVYISPHCKTQGNNTFSFGFWHDVVHKLIAAGLKVTVGYDGPFCEDLRGHENYQKHWGTHADWMRQVCRHRIVSCGNTGTGWLAAACGVPLLTMEPHNSCMADHRYRECGLRNLVEVVDGHKLDAMGNDMTRVADYVAMQLIDFCCGGIDHDWRTRVVRSNLITEAVRAGVSYSVNPEGKLRLLAEELLSVVHLSGHVCDLGSYRGGSAKVMRKVASDKVLNLFDTWEGNPHDDPLCHHRQGDWLASREECERLVCDSEEALRLTWLWQGVFPASAKALEKYEFCFVYVDVDTYQSTRDAIEFFWPCMVPGGKMMFDDWTWPACAGVEKAIREVFPDEQMMKVVPSLYTCIITKE